MAQLDLQTRSDIALGQLPYATGDMERDLQAPRVWYQPYQGKDGESGIPV